MRTHVSLGEMRATVLLGELRRHPALDASPENLAEIARLPRLHGWPLTAVEKAYDRLVAADGLLAQDARGTTLLGSSHDQRAA